MASRNIKNFEFKLGRLGLLLFTVGMAMIVFFVFLFGVEVGKNMDTYPGKYSRKIPTMLRGWLPWSKEEQQVAPRDTAGSRAAEQDDGFDLTFYDTLSKKRTDLKSNTADNSIGEGKRGDEAPKVLVPSPESPLVKTSPTSPQPGAARQATGGAVPQAVPPQTIPPQTSPAQTTSVQAKERYLIQVASYREKEKAEGLCKKIKSLGYKPQVTMVNLPNRGTWFRVSLSGFEGRQQAENVAGILPGKVGAVNCIIRRVP